MRFISTTVHGVLDYLLAACLILLPLTGAHSSATDWLPALLGIVVVGYSLATDYEVSLVRSIPFRTHLLLDVVGGIGLLVMAEGLAASSTERTLLIVLGLFELATTLLTRTTPSYAAQESVTAPAAPQDPYSSEMPLSDRPSTIEGRPTSPVDPADVANVEQLRRAIDSGATGDKVAVADPASVPLGADDEAGQPHDEHGLATARREGG